MEMGADDAADGRWMTHAELAATRGISTASAIKLALRNGWRKQRDNRGTLRCLVPAAFIGLTQGGRADTRADARMVSRADDGADLSAAIITLRDAVTMLGDQLSHERMRADTAQAERDDLRARLADAQAALAAAQADVEQVERGREAAETRTDELRRELEASQIAQGEAEADAAELRQAEDARKGRGRLARLRAAWRG
jgi:hypothetical protein